MFCTCWRTWNIPTRAVIKTAMKMPNAVVMAIGKIIDTLKVFFIFLASCLNAICYCLNILFGEQFVDIQ